MRYTCCSNLRQGSLFQASLSGSGVGLTLGAFLSFILLTRYLPYSSVYVCLSSGFPRGFRFLNNLSRGRIGWYLLVVSTINKNVTLVSPFQWLFCASLDGCYSPGVFTDGPTVLFITAPP